MPATIEINLSETLICLVREMSARHAQSTGANPADFYFEYYLSLLPHLQTLYRLGDAYGFNERHKVLEVGSGMGTRCLLGNAIWKADFTGLEPCANTYSLLKEAISEFRAVNPHLEYDSRCESGEETELDSDQFDFVLSFEVVEHVRDPAQFVSELYRVLKPGGRLLLSTCNFRSFYEGHYRTFWLPFLGPESAGRWVKYLGYNPDFLNELNFITRTELWRLLQKSGFKSIKSGWSQSSSSLPLLNVAAPDNFDPVCRNKRYSFIQQYVQRPTIHRLLHLFGLEYKVYLEAEK